MLDTFKNHITQNLNFLKEGKVLIAISGGVDSVVLTHLCKIVNLDIALAHCNFNLRGSESDADEAFVSNLAEELDIEAFIQHFDTEDYAKQNKLSIQMAARELRYNWFQELTKQLHFDYILTAHHADDNLETFLINFLRGTGLNGLTGIPEVQNNVVRPLLPFSREQIEIYAKENAITWREDSSNSSRKYLRNKLRHEVVPILKDINPQLLDTFKNTLNYLEDSSVIVKHALDDFKAKALVKVEGDSFTFKISAFKNTSNPKAYLYEVFKDFGFTEWNDVLHLLDAQSGKQVFSNTHRLIKHREFLILAVLCHSERSEESLSVENSINSIKTSLGILQFDEADAFSKTDANTIFIDKDLLKFPLTVRYWQEGDYFYPSGMQGKKKLSKFFKDEKLSLLTKERSLVLTSEEKIVWIIGKRADNRFKITNQTKQILKITLTQNKSA